ncbi:MAG TPA: twin-arginine translocase subunit TatC [Miltoncostaeaceae bacterium]|jgi:sec-independent protein translocase protein TatC|nr:twin-arginine translocase subunit TatC [Miltoncostaeaceae bacterium]
MARFRAPLGLRTVTADERLTVVEHLDELRRRLIASAVALVLAFVAAYLLRNEIIGFLKAPLPTENGEESALITLSPTEPFFTVLKVSLWSAILAALPIWLYHVYAFVIPAIGAQSRRVMLTVVAAVSALFAAGVAFGYFVVLPVALRFLLNFGDDLFVSQVRAGEYFGFVTAMLLASGLLFEVPVAMVAFARLGVASADLYRRNWRLAIVVIAALAAILPGGDPFSMFLLMIPQVLLYALGIWLSGVFGGPPLWERETWTADSAEDDDEPLSGAPA